MAVLGQMVGHYRLVAFIGHGGMGDVFDGFDEVLMRRVALKSIRQEYRLLPEAKQRFLREAQTLSRLEHPHICRIYDLVEHEDGDYLVLEFIQGRGLRQIMTEGMSPNRLLTLAGQIADVLVAAHGKGVIHRDLKPENVMVTEAEEVKVLDFGLSRLVEDETLKAPTVGPAVSPEEPTVASIGSDAEPQDPELTRPLSHSPGSHPRGTLHLDGPLSQAGMVMGTVGYLSPEQARGEQVTSASDMYAFGLLLQELLTGERAIDPELSQAERLAMATRGESRSIATGLDPDLTTLILRLKSLEPGSRPAAADVHERIQWILHKPQRQRRKLLRGAAMFFLASIAAIMTFMVFKIRREATRANHEAEAAMQVAKFLVDMFWTSDPGESRGKDLTAREILARGSQRAQDELKGQPLILARLNDQIGSVYHGLGLYAEAERHMRMALAVRERLLPPMHQDLSASLNNLAILTQSQGRLPEAEQLFQRALQNREKTLPPGDPLVAASIDNLGGLYFTQGRLPEAEQLYRRGLALREQHLGPSHLDVAGSLNNLASLFQKRFQLPEAEALFRRALVIYEKALGTDHPKVALALNNLAIVLDLEGKPDLAEPLYLRILALRERVLGSDHPDTAVSCFNLGAFHAARQQFAKAEPFYRRALGIRKSTLGPDHPDTAAALAGLAVVYRNTQRPTEARALMEQALAIRLKALGPDHESVASSYYNLGVHAYSQGDLVGARDLFGQAGAVWERALGSGHPNVAMACFNQGVMLAELKHPDQAEAPVARALAIWEKALGHEHPKAVDAVVGLAAIEAAQKKDQQAMTRLADAVQRGLSDPEALQDPAFKRMSGWTEFQRLQRDVGARAAAVKK